MSKPYRAARRLRNCNGLVDEVVVCISFSQVPDECQTLVADVPGPGPRPARHGRVLDRIRGQALGPIAVETSRVALALVRTVLGGRARRDDYGRGCDRLPDETPFRFDFASRRPKQSNVR